MQRAREFARRNRVTIDRLAPTLAAINASLLDLQIKQTAPYLLRLDAVIAATIPRFTAIPPGSFIGPEVLLGLSKSITPALKSLDLVFKNLAAESHRFGQIFNLQIPELLRSIRLSFPPPDPLLSDIFSALDQDPAAAERVAQRIYWQPNQWQRECIRLKSRSEGSSPKEVRAKALIQGVLLALGWEKEDELPIQIATQSTWLYDDQQNLSTVAPMQLPLHLFWNWIKEEAVRAAGLWLVGYPYAPTVVLETPPTQGSDWQLARFTSMPTEEQSLDTLRGRPFGSSIFENREAFLLEIKLAVAQVQARGNRVTQERVAEALSQRALMGSSGAERQLRRWVKEFGYADWRDLLNRL